MKRLIRKFILWAFGDKFRTYQVAINIPHIDMLQDRLSHEGYIKRKLADAITRNLLDEAAIYIESYATPGMVGKTFKARIDILKI